MAAQAFGRCINGANLVREGGHDGISVAPELLIHDTTPVILQSAEFQASHHNESEGFRAFRPASNL